MTIPFILAFFQCRADFPEAGLMSVLSRKSPFVALVCGFRAASLPRRACTGKTTFRGTFVARQRSDLQDAHPEPSGKVMVGAHTLIEAGAPV